MFGMFKSNTREYEGKNFYSYSARNSNGEEISMSTYLGKVCMIVNIASQYEHTEPSALNFPTTGLADENFKQLCELDKRYRNDGLVILGFPTNQFGGMEPPVQEEITSLIRRKYNVDFEIYQKIDVNGQNTHPLFDYLKNILPGTITNDLKWHFTKFLIDRNGNPVKRYAPNDSPLSFEEEIRYLLKQESALVKGLQSRPGFEGQDLPGQAGLQGQVGQQPSLPTEGFVREMDWEKGLGKKKEWERGLQEEKEFQGKEDWSRSKDISNMGTIAMLRELQRQRELELYQDHLRASKDLQAKGLNVPLSYQNKPLGIGESMNLQDQSDFQNLREREWQQQQQQPLRQQPLPQQFSGVDTIEQLRAEQKAKEWELKKDHAKANVESGAQAIKEKVGETAQYVQQKAGEGVQYLKESAQGLTTPTETGTIEQLRAEQKAKEWELKKDHAKANVEAGAYNLKEKAGETVEYVQQKAGEGVQYMKDSAQALKEKVQDVTGMGQQQQQTQAGIPPSSIQQQQVLQKPPQQVQQYQQPIQQQFQQRKISQEKQNIPIQTTTTNISSSSSAMPSSGISEQQQQMGFKKQEDLTGEGGTVGAQMGVHLGAHSIQAGIQAGKDPQKTQEQKK